MTAPAWRLVPAVATEDMDDVAGAMQTIRQGTWTGMLAAAPNPAEDERLVEAVALLLYAAAEKKEHPENTARAVLALLGREQP